MLSIICGVDFNETHDEFTKTSSYSHLLNNNHLQNINENPFYSEFIANLKTITAKEDVEPENKVAQIVDFVRASLKQGVKNNYELISLGISCLQAFVQINWLGPIPIEFANLPSAIKTEADLNSLDNKAFLLIDHFSPDKKVNLNSFFFIFFKARGLNNFIFKGV